MKTNSCNNKFIKKGEKIINKKKIKWTPIINCILTLCTVVLTYFSVSATMHQQKINDAYLPISYNIMSYSSYYKYKVDDMGKIEASPIILTINSGSATGIDFITENKNHKYNYHTPEVIFFNGKDPEKISKDIQNSHDNGSKIADFSILSLKNMLLNYDNKNSTLELGNKYSFSKNNIIPHSFYIIHDSKGNRSLIMAYYIKVKGSKNAYKTYLIDPNIFSVRKNQVLNDNKKDTTYKAFKMYDSLNNEIKMENNINN
ncbi:hypothetical protein [Fructilactobacillus cliffordii]|uniref:Uncharacterized protein n=1 Tax=Fructilactobacillus cliffordii TaxID=2940299 RepID=A0A9Q9E331_9LACO|nr:hypothetical protein [Fructilactobacillus cliffordii]USS89362.1 hypothetical protein M3M40_00715 [Fructilactobacillus cliffordii]